MNPLATPSPAEAERLAALRAYGILDSVTERSYDDIAELAAFICDTPISLISFVDEERQWFKSHRGVTLQETPRSQSFCAHTISDAKTLIVSDALTDPKFRNNPLVAGDPNIRFYAGAPIVEKNGEVLGTVCVIDSEPRTLSSSQVSALEALARQVVVLLEQRKAIENLGQAAEQAEIADRYVQESERRLRTFVESLPVLAWIADADGYITWYNRRWYAYTGTTPEQMEGWGWRSVHDPQVLPEVLERWTASIRTGQPFEMVFPLRGADGEFRPFLTRIEPLRDEDGSITQWYGTNAEVDALTKAQSALKRSEAILKQVLTATTDAVITVDRDWKLTYINPRAEELFGVTQDAIGSDLWEAIPITSAEGSPFREQYSQAMNNRVATVFEAEYGPPLNFTIGGEAYPSEDGIVAFSRDITRLKHAATAVLQHEKLAAVGRLASSIAHEINNPLEAVTNLLFLARTTESLADSRSYLMSADAELRRVGSIATQTLRFHRQTTRATHVKFANLTENAFRGFHSRLRNSRIEVKERDRSSRPITCFEGEIRQVITNLISNAIDALQQGGSLYLRGRDGRNARTGEPGLFITVADTGTGMSERTLGRIFEAFYTTKGISGNGLGLWISKEIVDRHRGSLILRSSQRPTASGTVFRLFLPATWIRPGAQPSVEDA